MKNNYLLPTILSVLIMETLLSCSVTANNGKDGNEALVNLPIESEALSGDISIRGKVKAVYDSQLGVREVRGKNDGPEVESYLRYTGLGRGNAWCAAFVCWVLGQADVDNPRTAWAASLFPKDRLIWKQGHHIIAASPERGAVFGIYFSSLKRIGHCGFIDAWGEKEVVTVEGNTNETGSREGDGVYRKRRPLKSLFAVADWIGGEKP